MTNNTTRLNKDVDGIVSSARLSGRELSIVKKCEGAKSPANEVIQYTGFSKEDHCIKHYCTEIVDSNGSVSMEERKRKLVKVSDIAPGCSVKFPTVLDVFEYLVENRGYSWHKQ